MVGKDACYQSGMCAAWFGFTEKIIKAVALSDDDLFCWDDTEKP